MLLHLRLNFFSFHNSLIKNFRTIRKANNFDFLTADSTKDIEIPAYIKKYTENVIDEIFL